MNIFLNFFLLIAIALIQCLPQKALAQDDPFIAFFSSYTSEEKLDIFVQNLSEQGIEFNIENKEWKNENQLKVSHSP